MKKVLIIPAVFTALLFSLVSIAQKKNPAYRKTGPVYIVNNPDRSQSVLSITEYKNSADNSWHYYLLLNAIKDNAELKRKEIAVTQDKPLEHEQLIGRLGNIFLVVTDSLVGYDEYSLEPVVTSSTIIDANPFIKDKLSKHHNSYLLDEAARVLYLRDENGDAYKLYPGSQVLKRDDGKNEPAPDDHSYEFAAAYKLYDRYDLRSAITCIDSGDSKLYILGSEKETRNVLSYFGTSIYPEAEENRQLTIIPYHAEGEKLDYKKNPPVRGTEKYFKGGFLQNKFSTTAWKTKPGERIILFQTNTIKPTLCVALIDKDGKEKWRLDTLMAANVFIDYLVSENNLLVWLNGPRDKGNSSGMSVLNIDLVQGNLVK